MKVILTRKFLKYFLISFLIYLSIFIIQFIAKYSDEVFSKGFLFSDILSLIFHAGLSLVGLSLLFGSLTGAIFAFRYYSKHQKIEFRKELLSSLPILVGFGLLFFVFNNWILPKSTLEMRSLIYEMTNTAPGEKIERMDRSLWKDYHQMMDISEINVNLDSLNKEIKTYQIHCDSLLMLLPDSVARQSFKRLNLSEYDIKYNSSKSDVFDKYNVQLANNQLKNYLGHIKNIQRYKMQHLETKYIKIILPIELLLLFILGASLGYIYYDQKGFLLVILSIYTSTVFYKLERLILEHLIGDQFTLVFSILILITINVIFLIKALKKEQKLRLDSSE